MGTMRFGLLNRIIAALVLAGLLASGAQSRAAAIPPVIYVNWSAGGAQTGASWADAYRSLPEALGVVVAGEQIWVTKGTYRPTPGTNRSVHFTLKDGVGVYGGFLGSETLLSQRDPTNNVTILSGDIGTLGDPSDNSYNVVYADVLSSSATLDGFTIVGGVANGPYPQSVGGGMYTLGDALFQNLVFGSNRGIFGGAVYSAGGVPTFRHVFFQGNHATVSGGAVYNGDGGTFTLVTFKGNSASGDGGAMYNNDGKSITLTGVNFTGNTAGGSGGAIYDTSGLTIRNSAFTANSAQGSGIASGGGAIWSNCCNNTWRNVSFIGNSAVGSDAHGGAVYTWAAPTLINVAFTNNSANVGTLNSGGALYAIDATVSMLNATFSNNSALYGGAIDSEASGLATTTTIMNSTFSGNAAGKGGGAIINSAGNGFVNTLKLMNVTMSGNSAASGGAVFDTSGSSVALSAINSIFWQDQGFEFVFDPATALTLTNSLVQGGCPAGANCTNVLVGNPMLGPLQLNGGYAKTMAPGVGSTAIDAVPAGALCPGGDQRAVVRPQGQSCDMGAIEVKAQAFPSQALYDGQVLESGQTGTGGSANSTNPTLRVGDDASNQRYRGFLSFNANKLPVNITVVRAAVLLLVQGKVGLPFATQGALNADIAIPYFGREPNLVAPDFQAGTSYWAAITSFAPVGGGWYRGLVLSPALPDINPNGGSQFRVRFKSDLFNGAADYLSFYSGDTATPANRPVLWVYYNP